MYQSLHQQKTPIKVGIAGLGAIGSAVAKALIGGIEGMELTAISDPSPSINLPTPNYDLAELPDAVDLVIECLPPHIAPDCANACQQAGKDLIMISACALLNDPKIIEQNKATNSRIIVPSGALSGIDGVSSLKQMGIKRAVIASTKKPLAYSGAPYIEENKIDLSAIKEKTCLFKGNALEAAKGFPANVNVAATLSLAGIGAEKTEVEIWADPDIKGNQHAIEVQGEFSTIQSKIINTPDPQNPKSSMLAAQSIVATLRNLTAPLIIV